MPPFESVKKVAERHFFDRLGRAIWRAFFLRRTAKRAHLPKLVTILI